MALTPKKRRGAPPPTGREDRMKSGTLCSATRRDGEPCANYARKGTTVCRKHGANAPQVLRAAQLRLIMASDRLTAALIQIAEDPKQPVAIRLAAIRDALDRTGISAKQQVEVFAGKPEWEQRVDAAVVIGAYADWAALADSPEGQRALEAATQHLDDPNVIDAEVVEDERPTPSEADERRALRQADVQRELATRPPTADDPRPPWEVDESGTEHAERLAREHRQRARQPGRDTATPEGSTRISTGGLKPRTPKRR